MNTQKENFCSLLECSLLAYLAEKGFAVARANRDQSLKDIFPYHPIKRIRNTSIYDLVEIQFDKHEKNKYVINFGSSNSPEVTTPWGAVLITDSLSASELPIYYRLYSCKLLRSWFKAPNELKSNKFSQEMRIIGESIENWFTREQLPKNAVKMGYQ